MAKVAWFLLFLTLGAVFTSPLVRADEGEEVAEEEDVEVYEDDGEAGEAGEEEEYEEEDYSEEEEDAVWTLREAPGVSTTFMFPDYPDKKLEIGEDVTVVVGFYNDDDVAYNISHIAAQLHSPFDLSYYIQNFTAKEVFLTVEPMSEVSVEYKFRPDAALEALEYWLSGFIIYNGTNDEPFKSTYMNSTIELVEKPTELDTQTVFQYIIMLAGVALLAYVAVNAMGGSKTVKKYERGTRDTGSSGGDGYDVEPYKQGKSRSARKSKSKGKKKNN